MRASLVIRVWVLVALAIALLSTGCGPPAPWKQEAYVFGTRVELLIAGVPEAKAQQAASRVLREFDRLHRLYHAWQPSELTQLNVAIAAGQTSEVSEELADLMRQAQGVAARGDYLFDPGIGRLISLWGFQSDAMPTVAPDTRAIQAILQQRPSIGDLKIDGRRVSSRNWALALDFGGYLKGVALDHAATLLKQEGIEHALINIGGNVMALGTKGGIKNGAPWRVGIQHPRPHLVGGGPLATLELRDGEAIGTSGDYHRYFEVNGKRYAHLIDPRTGYPATSTQALTLLIEPGVLAGMRSDALSKPLFIAGENWLAMAAKLGVKAVLRVDSGGKVEITPALEARLKFETADTLIIVTEPL